MYTVCRDQGDKLGILAPDQPSGEAFVKVVKKTGIPSQVHCFKITPRVLGDQINPDPQITLDLQSAFDSMEDLGYHQIAIACNTLQLWLPKIKTNAKVYTTFDAIKEYYPEGEPLIWLGTTPLASSSDMQFETLHSRGHHELQALVQEIIWRTKAVTGAAYDISLNLIGVENRSILVDRVQKLIEGLKNLNIDNIVLGCTELPIAFDYVGNSGLVTHDPATYMTRLISA